MTLAAEGHPSAVVVPRQEVTRIDRIGGRLTLTDDALYVLPQGKEIRYDVISCVRSNTLVTIVFVIPSPETNSATAAMNVVTKRTSRMSRSTCSTKSTAE